MIMFFKKRNDKPKNTQNFRLTGRQFQLRCSESNRFKGYKKYTLTTYKEEFIQQDLKKISEKNPDFDFSGKDILVEEGLILTLNPPTKVLNFYIDGKRIGSHFCHDGDDIPGKPSIYTLVTKNLIDDVIIRVLEDNGYRAYMYVKTK